MSEYWIVRFLFQRGLALVYLLAFTAALRQFKGLIGENGILPFTDFTDKVEFKKSPSLFYFFNSDKAIKTAVCLGIILSFIALFGISEMFGLWFSILVWSLLFVLYLSIVNVGQTFYGFGWESMLLETGFFAIFLGAFNIEASFIVILLLRWILFRNMFGAGLIKLRGDDCWKDLTCMNYHYETQPMPNPLSWYFDKLPEWMNKGAVMYNHFAELIIPFFYFAPQPYASIAGALTIIFHLWLFMAGNYSFLGLLSIVLAFSTFSDETLSFLPVDPVATQPMPMVFTAAIGILAAVTVVLSYWPVKNMISPGQKMNAGFNPLHLVNTYGAFGSITKERYEVVVEATEDKNLQDAGWKEYEFYGKPTDPSRRPPQVAPYHHRLDWQMWFLPLSRLQRRWFDRFIHKLAEGDNAIESLVKKVPVDDPEYVRARMFRYEFTSWSERKETGDWWKREEIDTYYRPVSSE